MAKTIIFCADGTWNGPPAQTGVSALDGSDTQGELGEAAVTNVVKLFANLAGQVTPDTIALHNEQEKVFADAAGTPLQVAKYIHGVGDSKNVLMKLLGGAFGVGVVNRIVRGFTFLSRAYATGDAIHIVGFSRGAYTARALAGMIAQVGLLDPTTYDPSDKGYAYELGIAAWCRAKRMKFAAGGLSTTANAFLTLLENLVAAKLPPNALVPDVPIMCVGVWDTVGSMGIPEYTGAGRLDILRFTDEVLSTKVERGFHAMAIDELRADFPVTRWETRTGIEQVWLVGAHADVGGGYPASGSYLSDIGLSWMMGKLYGLGLRYATPLPYTPQPLALGGPFHTPWASPPFNVMGKPTPRNVLADDVLHSSVRERWDAVSDPLYRPPSMQRFEGGLETARFDTALFTPGG